MPAWRANGMRGPKTRTEASMKTSRSGRKNWHSKVVFSAAMLLASTAVERKGEQHSERPSSSITTSSST